MIFMMIFIGIIFSQSRYIDNYGHLGGIIGGFLIYIPLNKSQIEDDGAICIYKYWFYISLICIGIFFITGLSCFYTLSKY